MSIHGPCVETTVNNPTNNVKNSNVNTQDNFSISKSGSKLTGSLNMDGIKITDLISAVRTYDAANKFYVDSIAHTRVIRGGGDVKKSNWLHRWWSDKLVSGD